VTEYILSFKPAVGPYGSHDPSAALFEGGDLIFAIEEERCIRRKHATGVFPENAIRSCLDYANIELDDVSKIILPYNPHLKNKRFVHHLKKSIAITNHPVRKAWRGTLQFKNYFQNRFFPDLHVKDHLNEIGGPLPKIEHREHHRCHAASAFYPTDFEDAVVLTVDGAGEYDSTVVWRGDKSGLERVRTYQYPNSLGHFFGTVTEYLGYRAFNGEGKIMGLAPYGTVSQEIESKLRENARFDSDYEVTGLLGRGSDVSTTRFEEIFDQEPKNKHDEFGKFEKDLARTTQYLLEETIVDIVKKYVTELGTNNVALAGGVMLNCKLNKRIMELDCVDNIFIQPVAHDGGLSLGAGWLESNPTEVDPMTDIYSGLEYNQEEAESVLRTNKISYKEVDHTERYVAERLSEGKLVGWFQGKLEMGPRALGNRSILADPRTIESRDQVNEYVKHREKWRPFAPSILEEAAEEYLINAEASPYMIKTFDTVPEKRNEIEAVLHPGDKTTRPQTVRKDQNPRYYRLISEFEDITDVPVLLNTSFNDHAEPIVNTPTEALKDFYGMGLDILVIEDLLIEKEM
jgi:carbamoyltransferase